VANTADDEVEHGPMAMSSHDDKICLKTCCFLQDTFGKLALDQQRGHVDSILAQIFGE
jgi:hypothetical protein